MSLKSLLPYEQYSFVTKLSKTEITRRLSENTAPRPGVFSFDTQDTMFVGDVSEDTFELTRVTPKKNNMLPRVKGAITPFLGKTEVAFTLTFTKPAIIFFGCWMALLTFICFRLLFNLPYFPGAGLFSMFPAWWPFFMWIGAIIFIVLGFRFESKRVKGLLMNLLEGEVNA
ncbi:hypothetical protein [Chitinophaga arvensicola]|uniref:Uncharacterized protein n=1 Tax=Chitinophaga arvensicola TaxID=29529 RepID=A0A1I0RHX6_9BACT|nr:hypothetical protein [Chitinophaga arvensicola]SEW40524.1 hypothetical protein SAMN04488122_2864 [Chitinophaga arvensicola]